MKRLAVHFSRRGSQFSMQRLVWKWGPHNQAQRSKFSAGVLTIILLVTVNWQVGHPTFCIAK